jgi:hypothetical protein
MAVQEIGCGHRLDWFGSGYGQVAGYCECVHKSSVSIKCGHFLGKLMKHKLLRSESAPYIYLFIYLSYYKNFVFYKNIFPTVGAGMCSVLSSYCLINVAWTRRTLQGSIATVPLCVPVNRSALSTWTDISWMLENCDKLMPVSDLVFLRQNHMKLICLLLLLLLLLLTTIGLSPSGSGY